MKDTAIGIDIGGTNTVYGIVDREGNCLAEKSIQTDIFDDAEEFVITMCREIKTLIAKENVKIKGIGIGAPNGNYFKGTIEYAPNLKWKGIINLAEMINKYLAYPVTLTNDANAAAIGEMVFGAAKGMKDFVVVTLGTGLGSGFVSNGKMIYGHDGFAGELGHTVIYPNGRSCGCGRKGCLETYASATGIVKTAIKLLRFRRDESTLRKVKENEITSKYVFDCAKNGDKLALEAFDYTAKVLGFALANTVAITSPEAIILFGGLAKAGDILLTPLKKYMEENMLVIFKNKVKILPSAVRGKNSAVLGASALVWENIET